MCSVGFCSDISLLVYSSAANRKSAHLHSIGAPLVWACAAGADPRYIAMYANHDPEVDPGTRVLR